MIPAKKSLIILLFFGSLFQATAQKTVKINLLGAGSLQYSKALGEDLKRVIGSVEFEHEGAHLFCDSAYFREQSNSLEAFGHIHININDTLDIYGDRLNYNGNTRMAELLGKVRLVDRQTVLTSDHLYYDRNQELAFYRERGRIVNKENNLSSNIGYYYTQRKEFFFRDDVELTNPSYRILSDTLLYNTVSRVAFFLGPSVIEGKENYIYCENGWYNTSNDRSRFSRNAYIRNGSRLLSGDSLYYDRLAGFGYVYRNVRLSDTAAKLLVTGIYATYFERKGHAVVTDSAVGILYDREDSLFIHADTLSATFDSLQQTRSVSAYHHVRFYRTQLQGICDSLLYRASDSTISLYKNPVLWSEKNQLTADTIRLWLTRQVADSMMLYNTGFIVSLSDSGRYDQVRGKDMTGYFRENELTKVRVTGNAETLYYAREDNGSLIGINKAAASDMIILLKDRKIEQIIYIDVPEATLYPEKEIGAAELKLKGFTWLEQKRPQSRKDIFRP